MKKLSVEGKKASWESWLAAFSSLKASRDMVFNGVFFFFAYFQWCDVNLNKPISGKRPV